MTPHYLSMVNVILSTVCGPLAYSHKLYKPPPFSRGHTLKHIYELKGKHDIVIYLNTGVFSAVPSPWIGAINT